jgi:16S rRNA (guanine527-N7)-methyltransferase
MRDEFIEAIKNHQPAFGFDLPEEAIDRLADFYDLIQEHNPILHLVGPMGAEEFAFRHVLESLTLIDYLPHNARLVDIGPGAGFPSVPCLLVREKMSGILIESSLKKASFLREVLAKCELETRAEIINQQFSELKRPYVSYITCRALDKFTKKLPALLKWSGDCTLLFFGGPNLGDELKKLGREFKHRLMPMSEQRFLFVSKAAEDSTIATKGPKIEEKGGK